MFEGDGKVSRLGSSGHCKPDHTVHVRHKSSARSIEENQVLLGYHRQRLHAATPYIRHSQASNAPDM